jgi:hypothetical protein
VRRICWEINVFSKFEHHMFYILYELVTYLPILPRKYIDNHQLVIQFWCISIMFMCTTFNFLHNTSVHALYFENHCPGVRCQLPFQGLHSIQGADDQWPLNKLWHPTII